MSQRARQQLGPRKAMPQQRFKFRQTRWLFQLAGFSSMGTVFAFSLLRMLRWCGCRGLFFGRRISGVVISIRSLVLWQGERLLYAFFSRAPSIRLAVAHTERALVFGHRILPLLLDVQYAAQINMSPRQHARIAGKANRLAEGNFGV